MNYYSLHLSSSHGYLESETVLVLKTVLVVETVPVLETVLVTSKK